MTKSKNETAEMLADAHFRLDDAISRIFRLNAPDDARATAPVRLLEVNDATTEVGIAPVAMTADPSRGVPYASVIVEVSSDELARLQRGELLLPSGWHLGPEIASPAVGRR